jgi:glyoxylase-like metal-dependent hydrolase (beta-lactamase superfamily II)
MKILNLIDRNKNTCYTGNAYLVTGDWKTIEDVNTIVDVGRDPDIISAIAEASTGIGKKRIAQVILTHNHYDHVTMLDEIREIYSPVVCAYSRNFPGVDRVLHDGDMLRCGDRDFRVIWAPGHSSDSLCLYCQADGVLFTGDNPPILENRDRGHSIEFLAAMDYIARLDVRVVYPGHGPPIVLEPR